MDVNDPGLTEFLPPAQCLGGWNCYGVALYNVESMRPALREVDSEPLPKSVADRVWFAERCKCHRS
jgi:hypothetical protein